MVNLSDAHLLLPELPLFVAGEEGAEDVRVCLTQAIRPPARVLLGRVRRVDPSGPALDCDPPVGRLPADGLVVALGSVSDDYGVPGVREHALPVSRWEDALQLRLRLLRQFRRRARGRVAVVGGGFTGVEVAAELASVHGGRTAVALVAPSLLPAAPEPLRGIARQALQRLGVELVLGPRADRVEEGGVHLDSGHWVQADTVIWAAGVRGHPVVAASGLATNRRGQAVVDAGLRAAPRVYCAGDCAAAVDAVTGRPVPTTAQAAIAEGTLAAHNLLRELRGEPAEPFRDRSRGYLVSLGRGDAAGEIAGHVVRGRPVAALKRLIALYHAFHTGGLRALGLRLRRAVANEGPVGKPPASAPKAEAPPVPAQE